MATISIIMPVKNASLYLEACLDSIQNQTCNDWELIAIDDHSDDSSKEIIERRIERDSRIRCFKNDEVGIISALQMAISKTNGTYITRMDADDMMPKNRLELMLERIKEVPPKSVVTGLVKYVASEPISEGYLKYEHWLNNVNLTGTQWQNVYRECVIASPNWMIRKTELVEIGAFDDLSYPEDYDLVLRWYQNGFHINVIPEVTLNWREHPKRTSRTSANYDQNSFFKLKIESFIKHDLNEGELVIWGKNVKGKLAAEIFNRHHIPFHWHDLKDYKSIQEIHNAKLLVAVYPPKQELAKIEKYLSETNLEQGRDWWFL
ncbi:MAG: glycosyltransferase involved in cell wall biosynthesis [Marinoscillum sp.]|jgi:glycosyltransferase involved in cell wall biosynthesis